MATDVDGVYENWGTDEPRRLDRVTPAELREREFAGGSMGPKVAAAVHFVEQTVAAAAEHVVHTRLVVLDLRRRHGQSDVLAGAAA